jgi:DNA-binding SARP family transcriptional activator
VATLVSRLRAALGPDTVAGGRAGYRLGWVLRVDLYEAAAMLTEAEARLAGGEPTLALVIAERAEELLGGGAVLTDQPDAAWAEPARIRHADLLRRARLAVAQAALRTGDVVAAQAAATTAVAADPLDEVAFQALMRAHDAGGEPARALGVYQRLRATLRDELGVDPTPETRELYAAILRNQSDAPRVPRSSPVGAGVAEEGFVGRAPELARVAEAWEAVADGGSRLLLVAGEAGIGKTRLAEQAVRLAGATGGVVASAGCYEVERSLSLQPVIEALTRLITGLPPAVLREAAGDRAGTLATLVPELATILGVGSAEPGGTAIQPRRCCDAVAVFLRRLSKARQVLLVLDDLHHADATTVQLVHYLARHAATARLLMVVTVRVEEGDPVLSALATVADRLDLGPLDRAAIADLAAAAGRPELTDQVERLTRGHTRSVVETLRALAAGESGVPWPVRTVVLDRVRRAGQKAEELLRAAAVLDHGFAPTDLAWLLDISGPEASRRCERTLSARLVTVAGSGFEFANDLIRQVLYDTTPLPTRLAYQRRAAHLPTGRQRTLASRTPLRAHRPGVASAIATRLQDHVGGS